MMGGRVTGESAGVRTRGAESAAALSAAALSAAALSKTTLSTATLSGATLSAVAGRGSLREQSIPASPATTMSAPAPPRVIPSTASRASLSVHGMGGRAGI